MNKNVHKVVTLLLVLLLTCGMFPAVFATDVAPEDTTAGEDIPIEETIDTAEAESKETESTEELETTDSAEYDAAQTSEVFEETVTASPIYFDTGSEDAVPILMAADDGIMLAAASDMTGTHYQRAVIWLTSSESWDFTYKGKNYSKSSIVTHGVVTNGQRYLAYCIDPGINTTQSSGAYSGSESAWTDLDINTQSAIALAILYGAPNKLYSTDKLTQLTYELATQIVIHELTLGYRSNVPPYSCSNTDVIDTMTYGGSAYFRSVSSMSADYGSIHNKRIDKALLKEAYNTISASLASHYVLPSFTSRYSAAAKTYEMTKQSNGSYAVTLTDTNNILSACTFQNGNGLTYTVNGNNLTITASTAFDGTKSCALSGNVGVSKQVPNLESETFLLWQAGSYQRLVTLLDPLNDPMPLYFNVKISNPNGTAKIIKKSTNSGSVKGWGFEVTDAKGNVVGNYTTDDSGVIAVELAAGTYTITETSTAKDYWINDATKSRTITVKAGETTSVTFTNQYIGKVKITKALADPANGSVAGWTFAIYFGTSVNTSSLVATVTTGTDGTVIQNLQPGTYTIMEQISEDSLYYCTDTNPQTVNVTAGKTASITFTNAMKQGKITVLKVDNTGAVREGAEFLLEYSADNGNTWTPVSYSDSAFPKSGGCTSAGLTEGKLATGTTGLIEFSGLHPNLRYRLTETKAPDGYQLLSDPVFEGTLPADQDLAVSFTVVNVHTFRLPETGSHSFVRIVIALGMCLSLCVGLMIYLWKK